MKNIIFLLLSCCAFNLRVCADEKQGYSHFTGSASMLTEFDREHMSKMKEQVSQFCENVLVEGYWASSANLEDDFYHGAYPFPIAHELSWPGQQQFLAKLAQLEKSNNVEKKLIRGFTFSRLGYEGWDGNLYSCSEYWYKDGSRSIVWTDAFGPFYVAQRNVKPSREFYNFVMNISL